jgi:[ribosomal protein S5]-alanine N-acetyltransferase
MNLPVELRTERLLLRTPGLSDAADVYDFANSPGWNRYYINIPQPFTMKDADDYVSRFSNPDSLATIVMLAIVFDDRDIGEIYLNMPQAPYDGAELGYSLSSKHWGKGFATEAGLAVIDWGFVTFSFNRIFATCDPRNTGSTRVLEKLGMRLEGVLRKHVKWNGDLRDQAYYGILRDEWNRK